MHYYRLSSTIIHFELQIHGFSRLTTRMIVHDNSLVSCLPRKLAGSFKMAAISSSGGSAAASEIRVYIQDDNHDKENIEDQDNIEKKSSEEKRQLARIRRDTAKKKRINKRLSDKKSNAARWSNDLILRLIDEYQARPCLWPGTSCSRDCR